MTVNRNRLKQLTGLMAEQQWDVLILYGHTWRKDFFRCLVNVNLSGPHAAAIVDRSGEVRVVVSDPWDFEALSDGDHAAFAPDFGAGLKRFANRRAKIAIAGMELMQARFVEALGSPVSATSFVEEIRRVKSPEELASIRKAAELSDLGYKRFVEAAQPGMTEYELVAEVESFLKSRGSEDNFMLIGSGGTEVTGMKPPTERKLQPGDSVTTELTPQVNGYWAQICRTLVIGEPSPKQLESFMIFFEAQKAAEELLKPGVNIADVARVQNDVFRKYGYGDYTGPKYTRVRGHNLGLHPDENPYVLEDVNYIVKDGMVVIAHPNTYLPLSGYMVFGDTLLVTAIGCVALNSTERKLFRK
ncbi:MAG TPA: Xaa-Pro peptidase family protein [Bryobacteraceae bacterium]|nr:Xaa-Pro peptidase family protein [Bryobacteraceae bacterium]